MSALLYRIVMVAAASGGAAAAASALGAAPWLVGFCALAGGGLAGWLIGIGPDGPAAATPPGPPVDAAATPGELEILGGIPLPLVLLDRHGNVCLANAAADALIGPVSPGVPLAAVLRARAVTEAVAAIARRGGEADVSFTHMRARDQRELRARLRRLPESFALNARVMIVIEDRTEAARVEQMRRDFIANASHELKTPLASISGFIETLQGPAKDDPAAAARFLPIMATQATRMRRLIEDLMSLNRIEMSAHMHPRDRVALGPLLRETAAALAPLAEGAGATITLDLPAEAPVVTGDRDQLSQLFVNLIDNAIKYGGSGGTVRLHLAPAEPGRRLMAGVSVSDDGPGIAREHIPRLTERFYRVNPSTARQPGGTGLGLSIVKHILNRHRGELAIRSAPGAGATFTAWLPMAPKDREPPAGAGVSSLPEG